MRVLVLGASGFIGSQAAAHLSARGFDIVGGARNVRAARRLQPWLDWIEVDFNRDLTAEAWASKLDGIDAVVNCVGVLQDSGGDSTQNAHVLGADALFQACERSGVRRVVHISAVGADAEAGTDYASTKAQGEAALRERDLDWVILRPSLVIGRNVYGGTAMIRTLCGSPGFTPITQPDAVFQPIAMEDLTETIAYFLRPGAQGRLTLDVAGPRPMTLAEIVTGYRRWLGFGETRFVRLPSMLESAAYGLGDALGRIGVRTPLRSTARKQMEYGVAADPGPWMRATEMRPQSLEDIFRAAPATVQDRWHARLAFLKPLILGVFALYWIITGLVSLGPGFEAGVEILEAAGFGGLAAPAMAFGGVVDLILGLWLLSGVRSRLCLLVMLAVTLSYCVLIVVFAPFLLIDPAGSGLKTILALPILFVLLAITPQR